jgi:hypothetical protein
MQANKNQYGRAIKVIKSDTVAIPNPSGLGSSGTATGTVANQLVDATASFTTNLLGAIVVNNTDSTVANVVGFVSETVIVLDANIFASGETYSIYNSDNNQGCALYIPAQTAAKLKVMTVGGDVVVLEACGGTGSSIILPINVLKVFSTDTSLTNLVAIW